MSRLDNFWIPEAQTVNLLAHLSEHNNIEDLWAN